MRDVYIRRATVVNVVDGDTLDAVVDLGFDHITTRKRFRILDIDCPEVRGAEREEGLKVKQYVEELLKDKQVYIQSFRKDSFGRWLSDLYFYDEDGTEVNYAEHLLELGYAKPYMR